MSCHLAYNSKIIYPLRWFPLKRGNQRKRISFTDSLGQTFKRLRSFEGSLDSRTLPPSVEKSLSALTLPLSHRCYGGKVEKSREFTTLTPRAFLIFLFYFLFFIFYHARCKSGKFLINRSLPPQAVENSGLFTTTNMSLRYDSPRALKVMLTQARDQLLTLFRVSVESFVS